MLKIATIPTTAFAQNTRIIADEDKHTAVVSDPGGNAADLYKILNTHELTLKAIILTHGHLDHVGSVAELSRLTGAKIIGPSNEDFFLNIRLSLEFRYLGSLPSILLPPKPTISSRSFIIGNIILLTKVS